MRQTYLVPSTKILTLRLQNILLQSHLDDLYDVGSADEEED